MGLNKSVRGFTITEMVISVAIVAMLMGYAWDIYFSSRETMRHGVSQSQMQTDTRIFFDHLGREINSVYRFIEIDGSNPDTHKFSFYCFQYTRSTLERIQFNEATGDSLISKDKKFDVLKIEYEWSKKDKTVKRIQTPGYLYFLRNPMEFQVGPSAQYEGTSNAANTKVVLRNIGDFEFKGYEQTYKKTFAEGEFPFTLKEVLGTGPNSASAATFIALRCHNKIDEAGNRRDEELDLVAKFYSRSRLADAQYPGYFSAVDQNDWY